MSATESHECVFLRDGNLGLVKALQMRFVQYLDGILLLRRRINDMMHLVNFCKLLSLVYERIQMITHGGIRPFAQHPPELKVGCTDPSIDRAIARPRLPTGGRRRWYGA